MPTQLWATSSVLWLWQTLYCTGLVFLSLGPPPLATVWCSAAGGSALRVLLPFFSFQLHSEWDFLKLHKKKWHRPHLAHHLWASKPSVACCSGNPRIIGLWPPSKTEEVFLEVHFSIFKEGCLLFLKEYSTPSYISVSRDNEFPKKVTLGCILSNSLSFGEEDITSELEWGIPP